MSALRYFTRENLIGATTSSPFTTNFRHLLPIPKKWLKRFARGDQVLKSVRPRDRVKHWNIVPGDQIRLLGDRQNTLHEVLSINRVSNRVFVKGPAVDNSEGKAPRNKNYHYSRCQLFVGNYEFPATDGSDKPRVFPVFAERLGTTKPFWNPFFHRFQWTRFATKTTPTVPHLRGDKLQIPWPTPPKKKTPEPGQYDTLKEEVAKVTYTPPSFPISLDGVIPRPPSEEDYLTVLYNRGKVDTDSVAKSAPIEVYLQNELANPHSRAKKLKRWKQRQFERKARFEQIVKEETAKLGGRTSREAMADAAFRWREELEAEKQALRKQRWKDRATADKIEKKQARKEKRELKQRRRLAELVLKEQPNQYIPPELQATS